MAFNNYPRIPGAQRTREGALPAIPNTGRQPFQPLSSGSRMNFEQPWAGAPEMAFSRLSSMASRLPQQVGNLLLYQSAWDRAQFQAQAASEKASGVQESTTRTHLPAPNTGAAPAATVNSRNKRRDPFGSLSPSLSDPGGYERASKRLEEEHSQGLTGTKRAMRNW